MRHAIAAALLSIALGLYGVQASAEDYPERKAVTLPADAKAIFLAQMLGHVVSLDAIVTALGKGDYAAAAAAADEMGVPRFQEGEGPALGLGEHLPEDFRAIGLEFRQASIAFAEQARNLPSEPSASDLQSLMGGFAEVTNACRSCHDSFRIE